MMENLYTTKMSANKKLLQNRFAKIRSKNGQISKLLAMIIFTLILLTMAFVTIFIAACVNSNEEINYVSETEGIKEYSPSDIRNIKDVELVAGGVKYPLAVTNAHTDIEKAFSKATVIKNGTGCSFDAELVFTKNDGEKGRVMLATDSCAVFKSGDTYYDYSEGDNSMLFGYFGVDDTRLRDLFYTKSYMEDSETALQNFFNAFSQSDLETMKTLVTNEFIAEGYIGDYGMCYGMTTAKLETCSGTNIDEFLKNYFDREEHTQFGLSESDIEMLQSKSDDLEVYTVIVTAESNIKGEIKPSFKRFLNVICKKHENGGYLVHKLV